MIKLKLAIAALSLVSTAAFAEPITIYTGVKGGGYDAAAKSIAKRMSQRNIEVAVENRNGSDDITLQACGNDRSMWIAQIDALYKRETKEGCYLSVVADYGKEVAMLLFPPSSKLDDVDELTASHKVFVAGIGSGSELTFKNMQGIEKEHGRGDEWSDAETVTGDIRRLNALANRGRVDAAFLVMKPNATTITKLLDSGWELGYLYDKDINDLQFGQKPLYESFKYEVNRGNSVSRAWGYEVRSFIGTTEAIEADDIDAFDAMLSALE